MAFEDMTYEHIVEEIITRIQTDHPNLDTREGSMLFNAIAPTAMELAIAYWNLDNVLNESFADTASREYLFKKCDEMGIDTEQFEATYGEFNGEFDVQVSDGSRWNLDLYNYTVIGYIGQNDADTDGNTYYNYRLRCETAGSAPNSLRGNLTPIDNPTIKYEHAAITDILGEGRDESTDEQIKTTYFDYVKNTATDGNVAQYERWCEEYDFIGAYKIDPLWNGANTVRVFILSESNLPIDKDEPDNLVDKFQEYLDPNSTGMGDGVAPIGAIVTVDTGTAKTINVAGTITLVSGHTEEEAKEEITAAITSYFSDLAFNKLTVSYMAVGSAVLSCPSVSTLNNLTLNSGTGDITMTEYEVPVLGTQNWTVSGS